MTDIAKCACGAEAGITTPNFHGDDQYWCFCHACGWSGAMCDTEAEAIAAWNRVMRPRPLVEKHDSRNGYRYTWDLNPLAHANQYDPGRANACLTTGTKWFDSTTTDDAERYIEQQLTAAGFDVVESENDEQADD